MLIVVYKVTLLKQQQLEANDLTPIQDKCLPAVVGIRERSTIPRGVPEASKLSIAFCLLGWMLDMLVCVLLSLHDKDIL